ncbi:hypothetical protein A2164_03185 [Candidatus Curtissbacteria bacterium RBG_13_35_7]|uniref:Uncharacterized protein n=1 Tax=Candidatus Curtissbacteria bacterium RBG_13_35_7 TaxID=1797705 RepID=A0A1F5G1M5_9BACT|nr:MAG: hypothetical protein A2164_03185 [Candidatus Curtissbacteria bacterium RBG_13_35_7]
MASRQERNFEALRFEAAGGFKPEEVNEPIKGLHEPFVLEIGTNFVSCERPALQVTEEVKIIIEPPTVDEKLLEIKSIMEEPPNPIRPKDETTNLLDVDPDHFDDESSPELVTPEDVSKIDYDAFHHVQVKKENSVRKQKH